MRHFLHFTGVAFASLFGLILVVSTFATMGAVISVTQGLLIVTCCICGIGLNIQQACDAYDAKDD